MARDNKLLGNFRLDGISAAPRGQPKIEVTFDIDANGILNVTARDQATGKEQKITITASTNMGKEDIERAIREAEAHAAEDRNRKESADVRNEGDSICYAVERQIRDLGERVSAGEKSRAEMLVADLRQKLKDDADLDTLKSIMNELRGALVLLQQAARARDAQAGQDAVNQSWQETGYEDANAGYGGGGYDTGGGYEQGGGYDYSSSEEDMSGYTASGEDVVDAEFREE